MSNWLLLRGLGRDKRLWLNFSDKIKTAFPGSEVLCLNLPGIESNSLIPTSIPQFSDQLREEFLSKRISTQPWNIMAISLGGMVALDWCHRYPQDFNHMVTINTSSRSTSNLLQRMTPFAIRTILKAGFTNDKYAREKEAMILTSNQFPLPTTILDEWVKIASTNKLTRLNFLRQLLAASKFKLPKKIETPYTILASKGDRLCSYKSSESIAKHFNTSLHLHDSAGHDIPMDDPEWIIKILKNI